MKEQDIAALIGIVIFAGMFSFVIASKVIVPSDEKLKAEVVEKISSDFNLPSEEIFNSEAINPAVRIEVTEGDNPNPIDN